MRARLLVVDPERCPVPPPAPALVVEDGAIGLYCAGHFSPPIPRARLEEVSEEDVRKILRRKDAETVPIYLSGVRELPSGSLLSEEMLNWTARWWEEYVAELKRKVPIAQAS